MLINFSHSFFSGDTRPSDALVRAGRDSTLLVHEVIGLCTLSLPCIGHLLLSKFRYQDYSFNFLYWCRYVILFMTRLNHSKATFDDDMADHAISKRHCTVSEALSVGHRMKVR